MWIAIGALSHIIIDCWNTSGVRAFVPFTQKTVVLFARDDWRIRTGSVPEIFVFLALTSLLTLSNYTSQIGGARKLLNTLMQSPKIATEEFMRAELRLCHIRGKWRWNDGYTEQVEWLVIGTEKGGSVLVFWDAENKRIIRNDRGEFMRARLIESGKDWWIVRVKGLVEVQKPSFWIAEKEGKWRYSDKGQTAGGTIKAADGNFPQVIIKKDDILFMNWKSENE